MVDQFVRHVHDLSPSRDPSRSGETPRPSPQVSRRDRSIPRETVIPTIEEGEEVDLDEKLLKEHGVPLRPAKAPPTDRLSLPPMIIEDKGPDIADTGEGRGRALAKGWVELLVNANKIGSERSIGRQFGLKDSAGVLRQYVNHVKQHTPDLQWVQYPLVYSLDKSETNIDWEALETTLLKVGYNEYLTKVRSQAKQFNAPRLRDLMRADGPRLFESDDEGAIRDALLKFTAAKLKYFRRAYDIASYDAVAALDGVANDLRIRIQDLQFQFTNRGETFPIPDWEQRLDDGNQYEGLEKALKKIEKGKLQSKRESAAIAEERRSYLVSVYRESSPEATSDDSDEKQETPPPTVGALSQHMQSPAASIRSGTPHHLSSRSNHRSFSVGSPHTGGGDDRSSSSSTSSGQARRREQDIFDAFGPDDYADPVQEQKIEEFYAPSTVRPHRFQMRADVVAPADYDTGFVHLLQTDNNVQPLMGAVHMVAPSANFSDKHFMLDVDGDINEGQRAVLERARRGPFGDQVGRSTIMDRSAHVQYRKRTGVFEITVRRGVHQNEMQMLLSKLRMHRMSIGGSHVTIVKGNKRYRLGLLSSLDLDYLVKLVDECIGTYGNCGLEIVENVAGTGALYKKHVHSARFKSQSRRRKGLAHK